MCKTVIFDVDGTLFDSSEGIKESIRYTLVNQNIEMLSEKELNEFVGFSPLFGAFKHFCKLDDNLAQTCCEIYRKYYKDEKAYKQSQVYEGIYELLETLKTQGYKLGVATYKRQDYAVDLMKHFGFDKYFTSICGADNENKLKKFDILQNCMQELGNNKKETILIGDSYHDGLAAAQMGVGFIGVTYGFGFKTKEEVNKYNPILCADKVNEIIEYFTKEEISV